MSSDPEHALSIIADRHDEACRRLTWAEIDRLRRCGVVQLNAHLTATKHG